MSGCYLLSFFKLSRFLTHSVSLISPLNVSAFGECPVLRSTSQITLYVGPRFATFNLFKS